MAKFDIRQDVTNRIIERIESCGEFEMPFKTFGAHNVHTGHMYRGINVLLTAMAGYSSPYWGTPRQWIAAGADISGTKCYKIVFWKPSKKEDPETGEETTSVFSKYYNVLNSEQVKNWEPPVSDKKDETQIISEADAYFKNVGVKTTEQSGRACYNPKTDVISLPPRDDFNSTKTSSATETYYSTLAHENVHATKHKSRCDREMRSYAAEELVAEIGAAALCQKLGISSEMRDDHVAYIKGWLEALRGDKQFIFTAASRAQEAIDWMDKKQ